MLTNLHISNIVLIDKLNLEFGQGLNVLTGETGAGKSILLDALALALGARSDVGLVRHGCESAQVVAEFEISNYSDSIINLLGENGIERDDTLTLRRTLGVDGKSRAWINDIPVSVKILKQIGDELIEIHGQFENHSLLDPATHIASLDEFGNYGELLEQIAGVYKELRAAEKELKDLQDLLERSAAEREFLEHNVKELAALNPQPGEEEELSSRRAALMDAEKNAGILNDAREALHGKNLEESIFSAAHILERIKTDPNPYAAHIDRLYEAGGAIAEIIQQIAPLAMDTADLEITEERLFALRAAARKHRVSADDLPAKLIQMSEQLTAIDNSDAALKRAATAAKANRTEYDKLASALTKERIAASANLRELILKELPDLKLGQADFMVQIDHGAPMITGLDTVTFMIKTNPGTPFAPLHKIASGGELARLMLALRVVLMRGNISRTFVFDEVDTGISGATASAVGARLSRLAAGGQALVITHSAQVAGFANKHFLITKTSANNNTITNVCEITGDARQKEIARIISGAKITGESVAMAKTLIKK
ncbi:MAG: DNA repair protein RecN [Alphaproteobacteria bacterium]|nr:DNA repair protein RecN [Alphaproteobacteria bacterium]